MSQPYGGQQPPQHQNPNSGGFPPAPAAPGGYGSMPQAPQEHAGGPLPRPGAVTGAAVLAYIQAGLTVITTIIVWIGVTNLEGGTMAYRALIALAQTVGIVLLIMGGVKIMSGQTRNLLVAGAALEVLISISWMIEFAIVDAGGIDFLEDVKAAAIGIAIFFAIMPAISLFLSLGSAATQFLASRRLPR